MLRVGVVGQRDTSSVSRHPTTGSPTTKHHARRLWNGIDQSTQPSNASAKRIGSGIAAAGSKRARARSRSVLLWAWLRRRVSEEGGGRRTWQGLVAGQRSACCCWPTQGSPPPSIQCPRKSTVAAGRHIDCGCALEGRGSIDPIVLLSCALDRIEWLRQQPLADDR